MATLQAMMGSWAPERLEDQRALARRQDAVISPYNQAIATAGARATSNALTAAQGSGNAQLAMRQGARDRISAQAPLLAQRAAAQSQLAQQEIQAAQQRREANQFRADRFLAAGLGAASAGLGGIMNMFGGPSQGQQGPQTPGGFGAGGAGVSTGTYTDPNPGVPKVAPAAPAQPPTSPAVAAAGAQQASAAGRLPMGQQAIDGGQIIPLGQMPVAAPGTYPTQGQGQVPAGPQLQQPQMQVPQQGGGFNLGQMAGQLAPLAAMIPGYGTAIGAGLGGLSALFR